MFLKHVLVHRTGIRKASLRRTLLQRQAALRTAYGAASQSLERERRERPHMLSVLALEAMEEALAEQLFAVTFWLLLLDAFVPHASVGRWGAALVTRAPLNSLIVD